MIQFNSNPIMKFDRPYQTDIAQVKVRIKMSKKMYSLSQNYNCFARLSVLPFVLTSVCITVTTFISLIFEITIKGVGNILLSSFKKDYKAMYGFKQLFIRLPLKVLQTVFVIPFEVICVPVDAASLLLDPEKRSKHLLDTYEKKLVQMNKRMLPQNEALFIFFVK